MKGWKCAHDTRLRRNLQPNDGACAAQFRLETFGRIDGYLDSGESSLLVFLLVIPVKAGIQRLSLCDICREDTGFPPARE
jgi:hypothetical protein